jgi:hypothetical protein
VRARGKGEGRGVRTKRVKTKTTMDVDADYEAGEHRELGKRKRACMCEGGGGGGKHPIIPSPTSVWGPSGKEAKSTSKQHAAHPIRHPAHGIEWGFFKKKAPCKHFARSKPASRTRHSRHCHPLQVPTTHAPVTTSLKRSRSNSRPNKMLA